MPIIPMNIFHGRSIGFISREPKPVYSPVLPVKVLQLNGEKVRESVTESIFSQRFSGTWIEVSASKRLNIASKDFPGYVREILYVEALTTLVEKQGTAVASSGTAVQSLVRAVALKVGVTVNAKYGTWDSTQVTVAPPSAASSTAQTPAPTK